MGFRLAARANGVAQLHGAVSRAMFQPLWPDVPVDEVPIGAITNGVHARTWVSSEMDDLLTRHVHPQWGEAPPTDWDRIHDATDDELLAGQGAGQGPPDLLRARPASGPPPWPGAAPRPTSPGPTRCSTPRALTIGFARRFATYKRATLLLSQPERLTALLTSIDRPVQFVFAGKAHPADDLGKEMIRQIVAFSSNPEVRHRFVFLDDYDIAIARAMYHGCDVWLNNPRRPQEACGTSGMKAALNGQLNLSVLDGWWDECYDGENGWAISSAEYVEDRERRDEIEANSIFDLLEREVIPLYFDEREGRVPRRWVARMKSALAGLGPFVTASRMVTDYTTELYEPAAAHVDRMASDSHARSRALAAWKTRIADGWHGVHIDIVESDAGTTGIGDERTVDAVVSLGSLVSDDVEVQLLHGPVGQGDELERPAVAPMSRGRADRRHPRPLPRFVHLRRRRSVRLHRPRRARPPRPGRLRGDGPGRLGVRGAVTPAGSSHTPHRRVHADAVRASCGRSPGGSLRTVPTPRRRCCRAASCARRPRATPPAPAPASDGRCGPPRHPARVVDRGCGRGCRAPTAPSGGRRRGR